MEVCKLKTRFLGKSGLKVSELCLGTTVFGSKGNGSPRCRDEVAYQLLDRFAEVGGNFIDTANIYGLGKTEQILGNWLSKQQRENFVIATKVRGQVGNGPNDVGLSRSHIFHQVEESLRKLQTNYIDLYQIHIWDAGVPLEETLSALNDLVRCGKVRYIGASNLQGWHLQKLVDICHYRGFDQCITLQQEYNLVCRESEYDAFQVCKNEGIGILPYSPLKGGLLTGKFRSDVSMATLTDTRVGWSVTHSDDQPSSYEKFLTEKTWMIIDILEKISKAHNKTIPQIALRWLLQKDNVSSVLIGAKTLSQLNDNLGSAGDWTLTEEEVKQLDGASAYELKYPQSIINQFNIGRYRTDYSQL